MRLFGCLTAAAVLFVMPAAAVSADSSLVFSLPESAAVTADGHISVSVTADENPGVQSWVMLLDYDSSALELTAVKDGVFRGINFSDDSAGGHIRLNYYGARDVSGTGTAFTAEFAVREGGKADGCVFRLRTSGDSGDFFNYADEDIDCKVAKAELTVSAGKSSASVSTGAGGGSVTQTDKGQSESSPAADTQEAPDTPAAGEMSAEGSDSTAEVSASPEDGAAETTGEAPAGGNETEPADSPQASDSAGAVIDRLELDAGKEAPSGDDTEDSNDGSPDSGGGKTAAGFTAVLAAAAAVIVSRKSNCSMKVK